MRCRACQADVGPHDTFCGECGEPVAAAEAGCPVCGAPIEPGDHFCGGCGYAADRSTAPPPARDRGSPSPKAGLTGLVVLLIGIGLSAFAYSQCRGGDEPKAEPWRPQPPQFQPEIHKRDGFRDLVGDEETENEEFVLETETPIPSPDD